MFATKLIEKIPDCCNAKEHCQLFIKKKNTKFEEQSEIVTYQPKTFENPNIVDIKPIITAHPKTLHKLSKTIKQPERVGSNSSLYIDTKKYKFFKGKKNVKATKRAHAFKGYANNSNVQILTLLILNYDLKILNLQLKIN